MRRVYDRETKILVQSLLAAGKTTRQVALETGIPEGTIRSWQQRQHQRAAAKSLGTSSVERLTKAIEEYLHEILEALAAQARFTRTSEWLQKQSAADLAALHIALSERAFRLLSAIEEPDDDDLSALSG